jgi:2'-5' RNA ligase
MTGRRLGVALVVDPPLSQEIDGLRRALGDRSRTRMVPHLTLVSPVNVKADEFGDVLGLLRAAAASAPGPIDVVLGPPATFAPDNPVLYLAVGGDELPVLERVRQVVFAGRLARPLTWPWVPHVTLSDGTTEERISAALLSLADYQVQTTFDRVVLLEERIEPHRRWVPIADAALGPRSIVGRGGLELELTTGRLLDPEAVALVESVAASCAGVATGEVAALVGVVADLSAGGSGPWRELAAGGEASLARSLVCTARREGQVVGVGAAWRRAGRDTIGVLVDRGCRGQGIGTHLLGRLQSVLVAAGIETPLTAIGPESFYRERTGLVADGFTSAS